MVEETNPPLGYSWPSVNTTPTAMTPQASAVGTPVRNAGGNPSHNPHVVVTEARERIVRDGDEGNGVGGTGGWGCHR